MLIAVINAVTPNQSEWRYFVRHVIIRFLKIMLKLFSKMYKYSNKEITYIFNLRSSICLFTRQRDQPGIHNDRPAIIRDSRGLG